MSEDPIGAAKAVELAVENVTAAVMRCAGPDIAEGLHDEVKETLLSVISAIVTTDARLDSREQTFLDYLVDVSSHPRGLLGVVTDYASRWERKRNEVPQFFQVAVAADRRGGTAVADEMIREIQLVCTNTCASDGRAQRTESAIVHDFISKLEKYRDGNDRCLTPRQVPKAAVRAPSIDQANPPSVARQPEAANLGELLSQLESLVGMDEIKAQVRSFTDFLRIERVRAERGLARNPLSLHFVFVGPPGTGKTTIARLLGKIFAALNFLPKGHLVETDRAGLVGAYLGQTALKVDSVIQEARGGVLFIDEAYALAQRADDSYGQEAIDTLLKRMEDLRSELAVFVAGYPDKMERFMEANPGLKSRFNRHFTFDHYDASELVAIFRRICAAQGFSLSHEAGPKLAAIFSALSAQRDSTFGNGRLVRNLFEKAVEKQAGRLAALNHITDEALITLEPSDLPDGITYALRSEAYRLETAVKTS